MFVFVVVVIVVIHLFRIASVLGFLFPIFFFMSIIDWDDDERKRDEHFSVVYNYGMGWVDTKKGKRF